MPIDSTDIAARNQLASDWMHRGMALAEQGGPAQLEEAIRCFDEAIALRRTLPLAENPWFRYGLSAGWINRGDAEARLEGPERWRQAVRAYDEALLLLRDLPLSDNPLYPRRLTITWINRGATLQRLGAAVGMTPVVRCYEAAIAALEDPAAAAVADRRLLQAGAWTNLAGALLHGGAEDNAEQISTAVQKALSFLTDAEETDAAAAQTSLQARRVLGRLAVRALSKEVTLPELFIEEITDAVDGAMRLARHWEARGEGRFRDTARELFGFGCRIYQTCQPRFLAEYVLECLDPQQSPGALALDEPLLRTATAAIWGAAEQIQRGGFQLVAAPGFERVLADLRELRSAEERVKQLWRRELSIYALP